jgi:hypothetical protein
VKDDSLLNEGNMHSMIHALAAATREIKDLKETVDTLIDVCYSLHCDVERMKGLMEGDLK